MRPLLLALLLAGCSAPVPAISTPYPTVQEAWPVGSEGRIYVPGGLPSTWLAVNRETVDILAKADREDDRRVYDRVLANRDVFTIAGGTRVRVRAKDRGAIQVDVLDGAEADRRGWITIGTIVP